MKNAHPIVSARTSSPVGPDSTGLDESAEPIIRLKLQKPLHWEWELTTSADALPVIQLLDKNGQLLVETTGRTAQRARGSFREGLRTHEQFPVDESRTSSKSKEQTSSPSTSSTASSFVATALRGNRNFDGFSNKFGTCNFAPRKSRSDVNIKEGRNRKKQSVVEDATMKTKDKKSNDEEEATTGFKIYSAGDYLRQQIMDDLHSRSTTGQTPEEIAKNRCRKVKAYLRSQSESLLSLVREEDCDGDETKNAKIGSNGKNGRSRSLKRNDTVSSEKKNPNEENRKVKPYLQTRTTIILPDNSTKESSEPNEGNDRVVRKIKDDMNEEELTRIRAFLRDKIQRRMNMKQTRSRSAVRTGASEIVENGIKKRYSDYSHEDNRRNYRTRKVRSETSILRFDPEVLERERLKSSKQLEKEKSNYRGSSEDSQLQRQSHNYRRSRSEVLAEALELDDRAKSQLKRASSSLEKRKLYRKTKSDVLLGQAAAATTTAADSTESIKVLFNPPRRIKSQENVERSWREYKERKRSERLRRESEREAPEEDDFMSKPRWKDLQRDLCFSRNCKICQNLKNCVDPFYERGENSPKKSEELSTRNKTAAKFSEDEILPTNNSRPGTSLQENYLLVEEEADRSPVIAKIQAKDRGHGVGGVSAISINSPDFGYNSIPSKNAFKDYRELYARSNVKKSDTFKIVDGSEDLEERANDSDSKINGGGGSDSDLGYLNGEGSLANKSNEDITRDYFKRVYELLKKRQEEVRKSANGNHEFSGHDDSSSSNHIEEMQTKRQRRRKKDKSPQGEEVVTVPSTSSSQEAWKVQRLSVNNESPQSSNRRRGCSRPQLQPVVSGGKRNRPAPPPPLQLISCRVNVKNQVDRYFDWPNKENTPGNAVNRLEEDQQTNQVETTEESTMGSNLSRHNGKGLTGRRTQSSGNLCDPKGKLNMGKILVPCSSAQRERYKFCGSLPNHLDDKDVLDDDQGDNNNVTSDNIGGNFGGTLPHKKRSLGVHFSDSGPTGTLDLVKHRSQDSLDENDPWRYQQSDLDLVRCRHGNFDSVKRNRSVDTVLVDSGRKYGRGVSLEDRCHRNADLDLVGTLPKRKPDARNSSGRSFQSNSSSSQPCIVNTTSANNDDDLLMKIMHKPDCELLKHRQQFGKCVDLKLNKLASGEPQDQGYASERSPEDEHPPSLPGQPFPSVTPESTFRVTLQKSSRGLGLSVSGGGTAGPVRVKRLFPQQPAALSNKLQIGDILLAANGTPLTGLTNYEALEVLRTTPSTVELVVCRLPGDSNVTPPGEPPPPPARREPPPPLRILNPLPPLQIEPCGEFDIEMTKVDGSLGFTLRKADSSALGHYVRALKREPALSDGRIKPGDKIVAVDGAPLSPMSHEEAVQLLRQCGPTVKLRLYRDLAQTPVSALSPTEPDHPLRKPRSLRQEAVDMLCDLAVRKLSPGTSSGSSSCKQQSPGASCNSPRRLRRLATRTPTAEIDQETSESKLHDVQMTSSTASQAETASDSDQCSVKTQITNSQANTPGADIIDPPPLYVVCDDDDDESKSNNNNASAARPRFLDLSAPQGKPHFQFCSVDSDGEYPGNSDVILAEAERGRLAEPNYGNDRSVTMLSSDEHDNDLPSEPASMPLILSSTSSTSTAAFSYKNPAYQSANPACGGAASDPTGSKSKITHSSDQDIPGKILGTDDPGGSKGLLKWKGVMFAPNDEVDQEAEHDQEKPEKDTTDSVAPVENIEQGSEVFMVELTRGWNSRLGFSLQPEGNRTVISVVHPDSVAAKDGRLKQGDVLLMVNEDSVEHMSTADIIDLLRKIRGSIGITVRRSKRDNVT